MIFKKFFNQNSALAMSYAEKFNVLPSTMYLILSRGLVSEKEIEEYLSVGKLLDPFLIKGMKEFCERIKLAKELGDRILIFGDYDVDGISATAIMLKTLKRLEIDADFYLPNRYEDGYGLSCEVIDKIEKKFCPDLIITVDCGISCHDEVEYCKQKGIDIIITDHHEIPEVLPETLVLNAKIKGQDYPFTELCGTGMAYKISEALLGQKKAEEFLPIAAIATIADIVSLTGENRNIVKRGFLNFDKLPIGLKQLFKENKVSLTNPLSSDIAFKIAPKINSAGRMGKAEDSLKLYMSEDMVEIRTYLQKINRHNTRRQELSAIIMEDAEKAIKKMDLSKTRVITLASKKWDQGILGIACARLVEEYNRPVFLFSQVGGVLHGSGRSIDDINIHKLLSSMSDILETFGGHTMAAGLTLKRENYEEFSRRVNAFVFENINDEVFIPIKYYDLDLKLEEIDERFLNELKLLEPYGCDNPKPKFRINTEKLEIKPMKYCPQHCNIQIGDLELVYFNFMKNFNALYFSRYKSFIFEFQGQGKKGTVANFDAGSFIIENANSYTYPVQLEQLYYDQVESLDFSYYPPSELLNFVVGTEKSIYGTAFVTFDAYEYVAFSRNYSKDNIFHMGIYDENLIGYNSLLLAPRGREWAKNFEKIIFFSPVLDSAYLSEIKKVSNAEIYLPTMTKEDKNRFKNLNLSRENFGKVFRALTARGGQKFYSPVDFYDAKLKGKVTFDTFYVAYLTFIELGLIKKDEEGFFCHSEVKNIKRPLQDSKFYNKLQLIINSWSKNERKDN